MKTLTLKLLKAVCGRKVKHVLNARSAAATDATFKVAGWPERFQ